MSAPAPGGVAVRAVADPGEVAAAAAESLVASVETALAERGRAQVALAGGATPMPAYERFAGRLERWDGIELWFGDERAVGPDDPQSNYRAAAHALAAGREEALGSLHRIAGELGAEEAARRYGEELRAAVPAGPDGVPVLDLALQGIGEDGHTASLFPGNPALEAEGVCAPVHDAPKPPPDRITLTLATLRASLRIVFVAAGEGKAQAVAGLLAGPRPEVPASLLAGPRTELIADRAALSRAR